AALLADFAEGSVELLAAVVERGKVFVQLTKLRGELCIRNAWLKKSSLPAQNVVDGFGESSHVRIAILTTASNPANWRKFIVTTPETAVPSGSGFKRASCSRKRDARRCQQ